MKIEIYSYALWMLFPQNGVSDFVDLFSYLLTSYLMQLVNI